MHNVLFRFLQLAASWRSKMRFITLTSNHDIWRYALSRKCYNSRKEIERGVKKIHSHSKRLFLLFSSYLLEIHIRGNEKVFKLRVKIHEEPKFKSFNNPAERIMQKFQQFHNSSSSHYELIFVMNMFAYIFILPSIIRILPSTSHSHTKKLATHQPWKSSCKYFRIFPLLIACNFIFSVLYCSACITLNADGAGSSSISEIKISLAIKRGSENKVSFIGE